MIALDEIFKGESVPPWLRYFGAQPDAALSDLLVGRADLGPLAADEPIEVLLDWMEGFGDAGGLREEVDRALAGWVDQLKGRAAMEVDPASSAVTAVAWCRVADLIAFDGRLTASAMRLRERVVDDSESLDLLTLGRSRDPLGRAWLAVARYQTDRSLVDRWWQICSLPPGERWFRGSYGIQGLRGLPNEGGLPGEVPEGLAILAAALDRYVRDGFLPEAEAKKEFLRTARLTMAAYPFPEVWVSFWRGASSRSHSDLPRAWIDEIVPRSLAASTLFHGPKKPARLWARRDPNWASRCTVIIGRLASGDRNAYADAERLLKEESQFAELTGDTYDVVRAATRLASPISRSNPTQALAWLLLARRHDPWNCYVWTSAITATIQLGDGIAALKMAIKAVERFPQNVFSRTGLAEVLKAQERFPEAEAVYRDTIDRFPPNVVVHVGLADVLKAQGWLSEAEAVYRETIDRFPPNVFAHTGLADMLNAQGRLIEAEVEYRETIEHFPPNGLVLTGLAEVLIRLQRMDEAELLLREAAPLARDASTRSRWKKTLRSLQRRSEADVLETGEENFVDSASGLSVEEVLAEFLYEEGEIGIEETLATTLEHSLEPENAATLRDNTLSLRPVDIAISERGTEETLATAPGQTSELGSVPQQPVCAPSLYPANIAVSERGTERTPATTPVQTSEPERALPQLVCAPSPHPTDIASSEPGTEQSPVGIPEPAGVSPQPVCAPSLRATDIAVLLADVYLLRRWGREVDGNQDATPAVLTGRAKDLLDRLAPIADSDSGIAGERGLLALSQGQIEHAVELLREANRRFPRSSRVKYALARAERQWAQQIELPWDPAAESQVIAPWRELNRIGEHFRFVQLLGEGRSWLALRDGATVENHSRQAFGKLAHWVHGCVEAVGESESFFGWWAGEIQTYLFGGQPVTGADDLQDLSPIRENLQRHAGILDQLEEEYVFRFAQV